MWSPNWITSRQQTARVVWQRLLGAGLIFGLAIAGGEAAAKTGVLRVGIDYVPPPPGPAEFRLYTPEGFDMLVAAALAERLGRELELVQLTGADRVAALQARKVDVVLARLARGGSFGAGATLIPSGFASGSTVAMRTDTDITAWSDLAGRTVCLSRGNAEAEALARLNGASIRVEDAPAKSLVLVRTGVCDAAIHDRALLEKLFVETGWQKFSATLPSSPELQLSAAVDADDEALAEAVGAALAEVGKPENWEDRRNRWARNVAFEVYLDQDAPDCH